MQALLHVQITRNDAQGENMGLEEDVIKLLKSEGFRMNETIRDALEEFLDTVNEENEDMEEDLDDTEGGKADEDED